jgi:hypothetical protein
MTNDFASFDRLDLGGTRFDVGVRLFRGGGRRRAR